MALQSRSAGTAKEKRNSWFRGRGVYSMCGELKRGISLNKKRLNRKVRHMGFCTSNGAYHKICRTMKMIDFS